MLFSDWPRQRLSDQTSIYYLVKNFLMSYVVVVHDLRWRWLLCFVDIGIIVDHDYLSFTFHIKHSSFKQGNAIPMHRENFIEGINFTLYQSVLIVVNGQYRFIQTHEYDIFSSSTRHYKCKDINWKSMLMNE